MAEAAPAYPHQPAAPRRHPSRLRSCPSPSPSEATHARRPRGSRHRRRRRSSSRSRRGSHRRRRRSRHRRSSTIRRLTIRRLASRRHANHQLGGRRPQHTRRWLRGHLQARRPEGPVQRAALPGCRSPSCWCAKPMPRPATLRSQPHMPSRRRHADCPRHSLRRSPFISTGCLLHRCCSDPGRSRPQAFAL